MSSFQGNCFVIMPFAAELHYFYLYLAQHVESHHNLRCVRADAEILPKPVLDKINDFIRDADVVIADCTGRNPNVFYELGIAHAQDKQVILITQDPIHEVPSDVRHYEFIRYRLDNHLEFLAKLDNALRSIFSKRYEDLYKQAKVVFQEFVKATGVKVRAAKKEMFIERVQEAERT